MTRDDFITAIRDNPRDEVTRLVYADWLEEHRPDGMALVDAEELRRGMIPISHADKLAIRSLLHVGFRTASWPKRFTRDIAQQYERGKTSLSPGQHVALWRLVHSFRRQLHPNLVALVPKSCRGSIKNIRQIANCAPHFAEWVEKNF